MLMDLSNIWKVLEGTKIETSDPCPIPEYSFKHNPHSLCLPPLPFVCKPKAAAGGDNSKFGIEKCPVHPDSPGQSLQEAAAGPV